MLRVAAGRLLVGLFFLGVLHSLEVVLPARAIDGNVPPEGLTFQEFELMGNPYGEPKRYEMRTV